MTETTRVSNAAAVLACVRDRPKGVSVPAVVTMLVAHGDGVLAWQELRGTSDALFGDDPFAAYRAKAQQWAEAGLSWVSILDEDYPDALRGVHDAPPLLFYRGDLSAMRAGGVSVVGTRRLSPEGAARAREAAEHLASLGVPIISGLASGVDTVAHVTALARKATPVGVIATPITGPYTPAPSRELHEQVARHGVLVSQFEPEQRVVKSNFIQRNATMSGLGYATIIVEAGEMSGTRSQAKFAHAHGRPVIVSETVVSGTTWGRALADSGRANVYVAGSRSDLHDAIHTVISLAHLNASELMDSQLV